MLFHASNKDCLYKKKKLCSSCNIFCQYDNCYKSTLRLHNSSKPNCDEERLGAFFTLFFDFYKPCCRRSGSCWCGVSSHLWVEEVLNIDMEPQQKICGILPLVWKQTRGQSPAPSPSYCTSSLLPTDPHNTQSFISLLLVFFCLLPCPVQAAWFQVGVVGPWGCDPLFAKALPSVAAQLAINRINKDPSLSYAATFDYVVLQVRSCESVLPEVKWNVSIRQYVCFLTFSGSL